MVLACSSVSINSEGSPRDLTLEIVGESEEFTELQKPHSEN